MTNFLGNRPTLSGFQTRVWWSLSRGPPETAPDTHRVGLLSGGLNPQTEARTRWRSPRPTRRRPTEKAAVCFGCRTRYQTFYNRTMRRGRDIDAAGWHLYLVYRQRLVVCTRCRGVKVEQRTGWPRIRDIRTGSSNPSVPCVGTCRTRPSPSRSTCMSIRSRTLIDGTDRRGRLRLRRSLRTLLRANKQRATAYLLKKEFGRLLAYHRKAGRTSIPICVELF